MKRVKHILVFILLMSLIMLGCSKDPSFRNTIRANLLEGSWCLSFEDDGVIYLDSVTVENMGFLCNFTLSEKGDIIVYDGRAQETKVAEWIITEVGDGTVYGDSLSVTLKMKWPNKYKYTYVYSISQYWESRSIYTFTPNVSGEKFVFLNNKNLGIGLPGSYVFKRK